MNSLLHCCTKFIVTWWVYHWWMTQNIEIIYHSPQTTWAKLRIINQYKVWRYHIPACEQSHQLQKKPWVKSFFTKFSLLFKTTATQKIKTLIRKLSFYIECEINSSRVIKDFPKHKALLHSNQLNPKPTLPPKNKKDE